MNQIPDFTYHKDPLFTKTIYQSQKPCICCSKNPGYLYRGETFSSVVSIGEDDDGEICPWCIHDGSANKKWDVSFTTAFISKGGKTYYEDKASEILPDSIRDVISYRTPAPLTWQSPYWWVHCHDAGVFLGRIGEDFLEKELQLPEKSKSYISEIESQLYDGFPASDSFHLQLLYPYLSQFNENIAGVTVYLFQCRHCQAFGGYWDCS